MAGELVLARPKKEPVVKVKNPTAKAARATVMVEAAGLPSARTRGGLGGGTGDDGSGDGIGRTSSTGFIIRAAATITRFLGTRMGSEGFENDLRAVCFEERTRVLEGLERLDCFLPLGRGGMKAGVAGGVNMGTCSSCASDLMRP